MFTKDFLKTYIYPVAVLSGGAVGVGFLSLPYITSKVGVWLMLVYFLVLSGIILTIHLIYGEISLRTPDFKRFPGFVGFYLGRWGKLASFVSSIAGYFGLLLVYLIIGGEFLTSALQPIFGANTLFYTFLFFTLAVLIIWLDIKIIAKIELMVLSLLILSLLFIFFKGFGDIRISNIFISNFKFQISNLFLPYGPILFALWGVGLIPETEEMLRGNKKKMKKVIAVSMLFVLAVYFLFVFVILGITGFETTEVAFFGLKGFLGNGILQTVIFAAALVVFMAFIVHGLTFKKILTYDLKLRNWQAIVISCFTPLILFLLGLKSFIPIISFLGGVLLGIDGILILLMYRKIKGRKAIIYPLSLVFLLGIIYELVYFIK